MQIQVQSEDSMSVQARAYAEYRMFAALAQSSDRVRHARVLLRLRGRHGACDRVVCAVTIDFESERTLRVRATGAHAYAAINRAVERVRVAAQAKQELTCGVRGVRMKPATATT
jgi:ribosome-associated translation inhibitor RaiA